MRTVFTVVLVGVAVGMAGCNSRESSQSHNADRASTHRAGADLPRPDVNPAPVVSDTVVNKAADKAINVIDTATASANRVTSDVNRTAARVQADAQQVTTDATRLTNDAARAGNDVLNTATRDLNSATRDLDRLKNALR